MRLYGKSEIYKIHCSLFRKPQRNINTKSITWVKIKIYILCISRSQQHWVRSLFTRVQSCVRASRTRWRPAAQRHQVEKNKVYAVKTSISIYLHHHVIDFISQRWRTVSAVQLGCLRLWRVQPLWPVRVGAAVGCPQARQDFGFVLAECIRDVCERSLQPIWASGNHCSSCCCCSLVETLEVKFFNQIQPNCTFRTT